MIRCVVTGEREDGKSVVVSDDTLEFTPIALVPEETQFFRIWGDDHPPRLPTDGTPPAQPTYFPPAGGYRFLVITLAPETSRPGPIADVEAARAEFDAAMPGFSAWTDPDRPGVHRTDTVDFLAVLEGEVWLELDDGVEVHLRTGDCIVQNGTRHAWRNRSEQPCRLAAAVVGGTRAP